MKTTTKCFRREQRVLWPANQAGGPMMPSGASSCHLCRTPSFIAGATLLKPTSAIHILPVVSQILRLSKPFISCYFVMSSEGLWACCLLLIGYKDGSLLRENLNFLMVNARGYFGLGDLLDLVSISNELYNSGLLASTYLKIIGLKVHYSIGREFFQTTSQTPKLYSCKQKP